MPSQTFYNLSNEKKEKLINASIKEFERVPFNEASINNIISDAKISRGSFYMYFNDKDDLFKYILNFHKEIFEKKLKQILIDNKGDLKETFVELFNQIYDYIHIGNHHNFFKNVFISINTKNENYIIPNKEDCDGFKEIINLINISNLNIKDKKDIHDIFDILMRIMMPTIIHSLMTNISKEELTCRYKKKLDLVFNGINRKDDY